MAGTAPNITWLTESALSAAEPMWLALWGVALIGISSSLRPRIRPAAQRTPMSARAGLETMQPSVARSL